MGVRAVGAAVAVAWCVLTGAGAASALCGADAAEIAWVGGTEARSRPTAEVPSFDRVLTVRPQSRHISALRVETATELRFEAVPTGDGDPVIELVDAAGASLQIDDDSGGALAARIERRLEPGTYCLITRAYANLPLDVTVRVALASAPRISGQPSKTPDICSDGPLQRALALTGPADVAAERTSVASVDEVERYLFSLDEPAAMMLTLSNPAADPKMTLYDGAGTELAENDDANGLDAELVFVEPLPIGDYCLEVAALEDTSQPMRLTVSPFDAERLATRSYDRAEAAPPLDGTHPIATAGTLEARYNRMILASTRASWTAFDIEAPSLLVIDGVSVGADPAIALFDASGRPLGENDDHGDGTDAFLAVRVQPGRYLVAIRGVGDVEPGFVRLVLERFAPVP